MQMSQLNSHLYQIQRNNTPKCVFGFKTKNINHFILAYPNYNCRERNFIGTCCKYFPKILVKCQLHGYYVFFCMATILATGTVVRWLSISKISCFVRTAFNLPTLFCFVGGAPGGLSDGIGLVSGLSWRRQW